MARWLTKEMTLNVSKSREAILYLDALQKQIKTVDIVADYYPGKIYIKFEGANEHLQDALEQAKRLHKIIKGMLYKNIEGYYTYYVPFLIKKTGKTFPIEPLVSLLELLEYETFKEEEKIYSEIKYNELQHVINLFLKALNEMPYAVSTSSLRNILAILAVYKKISVEEALDLAQKAAIIKEDAQKRLLLKMEPTQALKKCVQVTTN
ncbi:MAG: DUF2067 family protein [Asgard group archaeon]|nr:DUF2067 family protein [Asgard group archaeon]